MIYVKMRSRRKIMEQESETESQVQSQFPSQEERVHARAALAMFGKLDIEEQETASDDSQAETQQGWNQDFYGKLLTCERNQLHLLRVHPAGGGGQGASDLLLPGGSGTGEELCDGYLHLCRLVALHDRRSEEHTSELQSRI